MGCQLHAVLRVVAGHMGNDGQLAADSLHHMLQNFFPVLHALVDALAGRTVDIEAFYPFFQKMKCQSFRSLCTDLSVLVIAGIKCRNYTSVFLQISHTVVSFSTEFTASA